MKTNRRTRRKRNKRSAKFWQGKKRGNNHQIRSAMKRLEEGGARDDR